MPINPCKALQGKVWQIMPVAACSTHRAHIFHGHLRWVLNAHHRHVAINLLGQKPDRVFDALLTGHRLTLRTYLMSAAALPPATAKELRRRMLPELQEMHSQLTVLRPHVSEKVRRNTDDLLTALGQM